MPGTLYLSLAAKVRSRCRASTFWIIRNSKHDFPARVVRGGLLLCADSFIERQNLRHDGFDLSRVDELRDLCEVCRIRMNRDVCSMNPAFLELVRIGARYQRHNDAAFLHDAVRTSERFLSDWIEHCVQIL